MSHSWAEAWMRKLFALFADWSKDIGPEQVEVRRAMVEALDPRELRWFMRVYRNDVRRARMDFVRESVRALVKELRWVNSVRSADPHKLLRLMRGTDAGDEIARRRQFEAMAMLDLSFMMMAIDAEKSDDDVERDLLAMNELLERTWIAGSETVHFYSYHDPTWFFRVVGIAEGSAAERRNLLLREHPLPLRLTKSGIPFLFEERGKDLFGVLLKIWKQVMFPKQVTALHDDPFLVLDRLAFKIVGRTLSDTRRLMEEFRRVIEEEGGQVILDDDNLGELELAEANDVLREAERLRKEGAKADVENGSSSWKFRVAKFLVWWNGVPYEFQFTTFPWDLNAELSLGDENHELYKFDQAMDRYLPLLFPPERYRTIEHGWDDPRLRSQLRLNIERRLGWVHARPKHGSKAP